MEPILFVMASGIVAFAIVELHERWRVYQLRKSRNMR
jgi:hypothetical protein